MSALPGDVEIALSVSLYVRGLSVNGRMLGVSECLGEYLGRFGDRLRWRADSSHGRFRRFSDARLNVEPAFILHGGGTECAPSPYRFEASPADDDSSMGYVHAAFPLAFIDDLAALVAAWSALVQPSHGYAGFAFCESPVEAVRQANSVKTLELSRRFPGVEVEDPLLTADSCVEAIKGVNWLTVLSNDFARRAAIEKIKFSEAIVKRSFDGGLILQAGPRPQTGDIFEPDALHAYREVAAALKPIRAVKHFPLGPAEFGSFGWEGTQAWLKRFDPS